VGWDPGPNAERSVAYSILRIAFTTRRIRWIFDNISEFKIYKMSNTKTITLNQNDYYNITNAIMFYLENETQLNLNQNEINSILQTNSKIQ